MRFISYDDLKPLDIKYSRVQLWRLERDGMFPKRVRIGPQRHGWMRVRSTIGLLNASANATRRRHDD